MPSLFRRVCVSVLAIVGLSIGLAACAVPGQPNTWVLPSGVPTDCSADATAALNQALATLPDGATVNLPQNGCLKASAPLLLQGKSNITINGNGTTVREVGPLPGFSPIVNLFSDSNVRVTGLTLDGTLTGAPPSTSGDWSGSNAGVEGDYGVALESDSNVSFTDDTIENTQGDWVYLEPPYDTHGDANSGITFDSDTFLNAGYHGITVESVNGLTVENSTMTQMFEDGMDFEVDAGQSDLVNGVCVDFCQNDVTVQDNVWTQLGGGDWIASIEGPIQMFNLSLLRNTIDADAPFLEIEHQAGYAGNWTISDNRYGPGFYSESYHGGGSADAEIENAGSIQFLRNTMPDCVGGPANAPSCAGAPIHYAIQGFDLQGVIAGNDFTGTEGVIQPFATGTGVTAGQCWNRIGPWGATTLDAQC